MKHAPQLGLPLCAGGDTRSALVLLSPLLLRLAIATADATAPSVAAAAAAAAVAAAAATARVQLGRHLGVISLARRVSGVNHWSGTDERKDHWQEDKSVEDRDHDE